VRYNLVAEIINYDDSIVKYKHMLVV